MKREYRECERDGESTERKRERERWRERVQREREREREREKKEREDPPIPLIKRGLRERFRGDFNRHSDVIPVDFGVSSGNLDPGAHRN